MHPRLHRHVAILCAVVASLSLSSCSQSEYDACVDEAKEEFHDMQREVAETGGDVGGVWEGIESADRYAIDQCSDVGVE